MKETPISSCEKVFLLKCIKEGKRLDGRTLEEFRQTKINLGSDYGSAHVTLGETRVLAQVSCEVGTPKATRPNEGFVHINVELGPMAAINFEAGRNSELTVRINRILERTFKDSRCVDLESLCIIAEDKVWILRVDINVLNHEGNIIDCASIAALTALAHFKRPDVTVSGSDIQIHTFAEKDPIPIVLHHYPVCVSYATFNNGETAVADPTFIEERCSEASMIFGINSYRELCCLNLGGTTFTSSTLLLQCSNRAANEVKQIVGKIKQILEEDNITRERGAFVGFAECLRMDRITSHAQDKICIQVRGFNLEEAITNMDIKKEEPEDMEVKTVGKYTAVMQSNQKSVRWVPEGASSDSEEFEEEEPNLEHQLDEAFEMGKQFASSNTKKKTNIDKASDTSSSGSEEESTMVIG